MISTLGPPIADCIDADDGLLVAVVVVVPVTPAGLVLPWDDEEEAVLGSEIERGGEDEVGCGERIELIECIDCAGCCCCVGGSGGSDCGGEGEDSIRLVVVVVVVDDDGNNKDCCDGRWEVVVLDTCDCTAGGGCQGVGGCASCGGGEEEADMGDK